MRIRRGMIAAFTLCMVLMMSACMSEAEREELTNHMGKSVSSFERRSGIKLEKQGNGVYEKKNVVQVIALNNRVTSIVLLKNADKYKLFKVKVGMKEEKAAGLLEGTFGKQTSSTENTDNTVTDTYLKNDKKVFITYDNKKEIVTGLSYYKLSKDEQEAAATQTPSKADQFMLMVGDTKVYYNEAMVYLKAAEQNYENDYGKNIWKADIYNNGETFDKVIKEEVIHQITELKVISAEAVKLKISLTEEERAEAASYAEEEYKNLTEQDKKSYMITKKLLRQVYCDNLLADKVFENLTINVDTDVSDEAAKQITVQDIFIQNYNLDSKGKKVKLSDEDKKAAYKKVKSLYKQAGKTSDFQSLAQANTQADKAEYTFGKNSVPEDFGDTFKDAAFALKTGQLSDIITTDNGWHIIYCVSDFNVDATTQVKEDIIDERRNNMFSKLYKKWADNYDVVVNNEAWNAIPMAD